MHALHPHFRRFRFFATNVLHLLIALSLVLPQLIGAGQTVYATSGLPEFFMELGPQPSATPTLEPTPTSTLSIGNNDPSPTPTPTVIDFGTVAPTQTPTNFPTATPTDFPTATPTETATPTDMPPTVEPSSTPTLPSPTVTPETPLTFTLVTTPTELIPGFPFVLTLAGEELEKISDTSEMVVTVKVPEGITPAMTDGVSFDTNNRTLTFSQSLALGQVVWNIDPDTHGPYTFEVVLYLGNIAHPMTVTVPEYGVFKIAQTGGKAEGLNGRVSVTVPQGAVREDIVLRIQPIPAGQVAYALSGHPFRLTAEGQTSHLAITKFDELLTVVVKYDEATISGHESGLELFYYDEDGEIWRSLSSWADTENNLLYGYTNHFSFFDEDVRNWEMAHIPNLDAFQVSSFTGAATYNLPIWTPPGPAGLQPSVSINYNSQTVDGATGRTQAGIAGMGWSLSAGGAIQRNMNGTNDDLSDDTFSFVAGGVSSTLLPIAESTNPDRVEFRTADESFWRIYGYTYNVDSQTKDFGYWEAWDKTGTKYVFGGTPDSKALFPRYDFDTQGCFDGYIYWNWGLSTTTNIFGKALTYSYVKESADINLDWCDDDWRTVDRAINLETIEYPNHKYRVVFVYVNSRLDYDEDWADTTNDTARVLFTLKKLTEIYIQHENNGDTNSDGNMWEGTEEKVRRYVLTYESTSTQMIFPNLTWWHPGDVLGRTPTLEKIQEIGKNGSSTLPPTSFVYGDKMHLTQASNGYGGKVEFVYEATPYHELDNNKDSGAIQDLNPCPTENGWEKVNTWTNITCGGGVLKIERNVAGSQDLEIYTVLAPSHMRPGSFYRLSISAWSYTVGTPFYFGLSDGTADGNSTVTYPPTSEWASLNTTNQMVVNYLFADADAQHVAIHIRCNPGSALNSMCRANTEFRATPLVTKYRVTQRKLYDGTNASPLVFTYSYDEPATNDTTHSAAVATAFAPGNAGDDDLLSSQYAEYRGNSWVRSEDPAGLVSYQWFHQDDDRNGSGYTSLTMTNSYWEAFESSTTWGNYASAWSTSGSGGTVSVARQTGDNAVKITESTNSWQGIVRNSATLSNGEVALFRLMVESGTTLEVGLDYGTYPNSTFRRLGVRFNGSNGTIDPRYIIGTTDSIVAGDISDTFTPGTWLTVMFLVDDTNLRIRIWDEDSPAAYEFVCGVNNSCPMSNYIGKTWKFILYANNSGSGAKTAWFDEYSEGTLYALSAQSHGVYDSSSYGVNVLNTAPGAAGGTNFDLQKIVWTRLDWDASVNFEGNAEYVQKGTDYDYFTAEQNGYQFGNLVRKIDKFWDGTAWDEYRVTRTYFYPVSNGSVYLVGLPARVLTYNCPSPTCGYAGADHTSDVLYFYDNNTSYATAPTVGVMAGTRTWLRGAYSAKEWGTVKNTYDAWGNLVTVTNYTGYTTSTNFGTIPTGAQATNTCYGVANTPTGCTDDGYYTYPLWTKNALNHQTTMSYLNNGAPDGYACGVPYSITDPNGNATTANYDVFCRLTQVVKPGDSTSSPTISLNYNDIGVTAFNPAANSYFRTIAVQKIDSTLSTKVRKFYDGLGRLVQTHLTGLSGTTYGAVLLDNSCTTDGNTTEDLCDIVTYNTYNSTGQLWKQTVPDAVAAQTTDNYVTPTSQPQTVTTYDILGRTYQITAPDGTPTTYTYGLDTVNQVSYVTVSDPLSNETTTYSDIWGRTLEVHPPTTPYTRYTYNALDQLTNVDQLSAGLPSYPVPIAGFSTTLAYDAGGRKTSMDDPDMGVWTYTYDALGNMDLQTDARGKRICFYYDTLNRLTYKHYRDDDNCPTSLPTPPSGLDVKNIYDVGGNEGVGYRTTMMDGSGHTNWYYDTRGRITQENKFVIPGTSEFITQWSYNSADMPLTMTFPGDNTGISGETIRYSYLPQGTLDTLCYWNNSACSFSYVSNTIYDEAGRIRRQDNALNGTDLLTHNYYYNLWTVAPAGAMSQLLGQKIIGGTTTTVQNLYYTYDSVGNVKTIRDVQNSNQKQCFGYDALYRLTSAAVGNNDATCSGTLGNGEYANEAYVYGASAGRIYSKTGVGTYTYDANHVHAVASTTSGGHSATYDANGNMITRSSTAQGTFTFTYDAENRLISVTKTGFSATFVYDGDGNRVKATINGVTTTFIGNYFEWSGSNDTKVRYYYAGGQRIAMRTGNNVPLSNLTYLLGDHLGSTSLTYKADTGATTTQLYSPWGEVRYSSGTLPTDYTYTGQYSHTADFGLMYYVARWYDPVLGRFAQADTIVPGAGNPMAWDRYAYTSNNPLNYTDPSGHMLCSPHRPCEPTTPYNHPAPNATSKTISKMPLGVALLNGISIGAQDVATYSSTIGGILELGGLATAGPKGFIAGNAVHQASTNLIETALGVVSTTTTVILDVIEGETGLNDNNVLMLGEDSATALVLQGTGTIMPFGFIDAPIDAYGSAYNYGKVPGIYNEDIQGDTLEVPFQVPGLLPGLIQSAFDIDLGTVPVVQFGEWEKHRAK